MPQRKRPSRRIQRGAPRLAWLTGRFLENFAKLHGLSPSFGRNDLASSTEWCEPWILRVKPSTRLYRSIEAMAKIEARRREIEANEFRSKVLSIAALRCCDTGVTLERAVAEAAEIAGVVINDPASFAMENIGELTSLVAKIMSARWNQLKNALKVRVAASIATMIDQGLVEQAFHELANALASGDEARRERAAKAVRDIAMKLIQAETEPKNHSQAQEPKLTLVFDE